jgi:hypothetical protein
MFIHYKLHSKCNLDHRNLTFYLVIHNNHGKSNFSLPVKDFDSIVFINRPGVPPVHGFPPSHFPPQAPVPTNPGNGRPPSSRSPTPEDHSSRSSTPEENRPSGNGGDNEKSSKDDRYKDRYRY